ncbi:hypothetical protein Igag_1035 [Ignisphaera aggregans DSM 17230]|uniref:DUF4203 domain-containing protein n=1 Tax=Ignisphaera aggregans (strain DSM 17230 / JCM 13409 / AQ1.S1) TaxID=583356 RepID=E0SNQ3_IGNAA|nr:hypothetical protein Igag_1035 [Ignisphaera aggregans DSM 17230]
MNIDAILTSFIMIIIGIVMSLFGYAMSRLLTALAMAAITFYLSIQYLYAHTHSLVFSSILAIFIALVIGGISFVFYRAMLGIAIGIIISTIISRAYGFSGIQLIALAVVFSAIAYFLSKYIVVIALALLGSAMIYLGLVRLGIDIFFSLIISAIMFVAGVYIQFRG